MTYKEALQSLLDAYLALPTVKRRLSFLQLADRGWFLSNTQPDNLGLFERTAGVSTGANIMAATLSTGFMIAITATASGNAVTDISNNKVDYPIRLFTQ